MKTRTCVAIAACTLAIGVTVGYFAGAGVTSWNQLNEPPEKLIGIWESTGARGAASDLSRDEPVHELRLFADWTYIYFHRADSRDNDVIGTWHLREGDLVLRAQWFGGTATDDDTKVLHVLEEAGSQKLRDAEGRIFTRTNDLSRIVFNDIEVGRTTSSHAYQTVFLATRRKFTLWEFVSSGGQLVSN